MQRRYRHDIVNIAMFTISKNHHELDIPTKMTLKYFKSLQTVLSPTVPRTVLSPTDRPKSVRNRCVIKVFGGVFYVVTLLIGFFCWCRGFVTGLSQISSFFSFGLIKRAYLSVSTCNFIEHFHGEILCASSDL